MPIPLDFDPDAASVEDSLFGLPFTPEEAALVVIPVPFEATASSGRGTVGGPDAVRVASGQVDLFDLEFGDVWRRGIAMLPVDPAVPDAEAYCTARALPVIDAGGPADPELEQAVAEVNGRMADLMEVVYRQAAALLEAGKIPAVLGGDHSVPFGAMKAAAERHPGLGVLHVDAHADLRVAFEGFEYSHASIFHNVMAKTQVQTLVQVGIRDVGSREVQAIEADPRIHTWFDTETGRRLCAGESWQDVCDQMVAALPDTVWVSVDIDGLDPSLCPNTGTPVPGGLSWHQFCVLLRTLALSGRTIVGFDLVEVADSDWDATVGARALYKLAGWALHTQSVA